MVKLKAMIAQANEKVDTLKATVAKLERDLSDRRAQAERSAEGARRLTDALLRHVKGRRLVPGDDLLLEGEGVNIWRRR